METIGLVTQAEYVLRTRQVYVDVALRPRPVTETVPDGGVGGAAAMSAGERKPLASFLTPGSVLAVLGAAGSGKTTLVRYTALEMAEQRRWPWQAEFWQPRRIPVLLYLRDHAQAILAEPTQNLAAIAAAAPWLEDVVTERWLEYRLDQARCVVLLDGLDEVADSRERHAVVEWVNTQVKRYPGNTMVVTSRPLGYEANRVAQADVLQVQRFTHPQISEFLSAWFRAIEHRARLGADPGEIDRIAARRAADLTHRITVMPALLDLAANPLLLTMIANVHRYHGSLPGSRADLYAEMCQVLLHRRQEAKNLSASHPALDELSGSAKERLIRRLAWQMMLQHHRDIPVAEAEAAIGDLPDQHQPDPPLTAHAFLEHARRSGLLLEHKPGHYGFAHLSLQEYLAAAHVPGDESRRRVLIDQVSDPWWRETILLWAAHNDASPVVDACLAARTVPALSLAYACADQAAELNQRLRQQLTELLDRASPDPAETRLLDGVAADRQLHDSTRLDDGTAICATPVSQDLWNRYVRHLRSGDLHASAPAPMTIREPIRGLWAADLSGFLNWLNGLSDNGPAYRLPTYDELAQVPAWTEIVGGTVWTHDEANGHRLYQPDGIPHPHSPTRAQVGACPNLIVDRTCLLLHQATSTRLQLPHLLLYGYLTTHEGRPGRPEHSLIHIFDLLATIDAVRVLDRARDLSRVRDLAIDRARALARELTHDPNLIFEVDRDPAQAITRALTHKLDLDLVDDLARELARILVGRGLRRDLDLTLDLTLVLARDVGFDLNLNLRRAYERDRPRGLDRDLDRALTRSLGLDLTLAHDLNLDRALNRDIDLDRDLDLDRALTRGLNRALARGLDRDRALSRALDLAVARLLHSDRRYLEVTWAGIGLLEAHAARISLSGNTALGFQSCIAVALADYVQDQPQDDPPRVLERVIESISAQGENPWVCGLLRRARKLIAPSRGSDSSAAQDNLLATALVLAAILAMTGSSPQSKSDDPNIVLLRGALTALIALTVPENENQTILLVRN